MMWRFIAGLCLTAVLAQSASAQLLVMGDGAAKECFDRVKFGDPGRHTTIANCEAALDDISLRIKDRAATHVNVGILYMRAKQYKKSQHHYDAALKMAGDLPEIHINLSANYIYTGDYEKALAAANKGIELGTDKMPEALYNRAMAYDYLDRYNEAYHDLKRALELRPDWPPALKAIDNYEVTPKSSGPQG
jgi:tetratricopeptide (TPR) repeat protein